MADKDGKTLLFHAVWNENLELIQWLLKQRVKVDVVSKKERNSKTNTRQLLRCIFNSTNKSKQKKLRNISISFNDFGHSPLLRHVDDLFSVLCAVVG